MSIAIQELQKELTHWKANHSNISLRCQLLRDRWDLPVERIRAFEQMEVLQNENLALKEHSECDKKIADLESAIRFLESRIESLEDMAYHE
jgi:hypothetical protein